MPRPFALRFRWPVTPVDRTKVVPNGNPCQIVRRMAGRAVPERPAHGILAGTVKRRPGGTERKGTDGAGRRRKRTGTEPGMRKAGSARNPAFGPAHGRTKYRKLLLLFAQDTHRHVENRRVVQRHDTAVGTRFEVHADTLLGLVFASEIVADGFYVYSQFICDTLRTAARQPVLDTTQLVKCDNHIC